MGGGRIAPAKVGGSSRRVRLASSSRVRESLLMKAMVFPSGLQLYAPTPSLESVSFSASPPSNGRMKSCDRGASAPAGAVPRPETNEITEPSRDQAGADSPRSLKVIWRGGLDPSPGTSQR